MTNLATKLQNGQMLLLRYYLQFMLQKLAHILFEAADDCGYVDPKKVEQILETPREATGFLKMPKGLTFLQLKCQNQKQI